MDTFDPNGPVLLHGYAVDGVASLQELSRIGPLSKVNFFVGRNNHGKSTVLRASQLFCGRGVDKENVNALLPNARTQQFGTIEERRREYLVIVNADEILKALNMPGRPEKFLTRAAAAGLGQVHGSRLHVWVRLTNTRARTVDEHALNFQGWSAAFERQPDSTKLAAYLTSPELVTEPRGARGGLLATLGDLKGPSWAWIPAFREVTEGPGTESDKPDLNRGQGLIAELQRWQSPDNNDRTHAQDEARYRRLTALLQDVIEDPDAILHIPDNLRTAQVATIQTGGRRLDIEVLGDGIKQVLMLGAAALRHSQTVICIEEPEIHLHPGLQRKLMRHLVDRTDNQYLIATHSTHILDTLGAAVFHVVHNGTSTRVSAAVHVNDLVRVGEDLGYRPSDLLQANYVLWVEGPADRLYWSHWLSLIDPELIDGVHYTAMSYGGSLGAHVTLGHAEDPVAVGHGEAVQGEALEVEAHETRDLTDLLTLGRRCTLVADSDLPNGDAPLRGELERLAAAAADGTGDLVVLTHVRTVENLVPNDILMAAVLEAHPRLGQRYTPPIDRYGQPFGSLDDSAKSVAKVAVARAAIDLISIDHIDENLRDAVSRLAKRIPRDHAGLGRSGSVGVRGFESPQLHPV